jgi:hypothetical protein
MPRLKKHVQLAHTLTAAAATVNSIAYDGEPYDIATLFIDITAVTGTTPTLVVGLQSSPDGGTTWYSLGNGPSITTVSTQRQVYQEPIGMLVRVPATIGGTTPAFTGTVRLELSRSGE